MANLPGSWLAFRLGAPSYAEAVGDGGTPATEIGPDWLRFEPWDTPGKTGARERLRRWCRRALADATTHYTTESESTCGG